MSMISSCLLARSPRNAGRTLGVIHFDAHTDLLHERDGIQCSFATWAYHANEAIGRGGRLQQLGTRICVSAAWAEGVKQFHGRPIGDLVLRGRGEVIRAFEPLSNERYDDAATKSYLDAFALLEAGNAGAVAGFAAHVGKQPDDRLASFHLKRLLNGAKGTRIVMENDVSD